MARTALVVDDSRVVRKAARRMLESFGYTVAEAEDGQVALTACHAAPLPELVLLDWNMPVMDGITFLRRVREDFGPDHPQVVLCTTEAEMDRILQALEAGAQEYIMKPFDATILGGKLAQIGLLDEAEVPA